MKYDERTCKVNMDTGCVELLLRDGRKISIDCTGVEDALDVTMAQRSELDYLIYNDPLGYADLILNGDPEGYLKKEAAGGILSGLLDVVFVKAAFGSQFLDQFGVVAPDAQMLCHQFADGSAAAAKLAADSDDAFFH